VRDDFRPGVVAELEVGPEVPPEVEDGAAQDPDARRLLLAVDRLVGWLVSGIVFFVAFCPSDLLHPPGVVPPLRHVLDPVAPLHIPAAPLPILLLLLLRCPHCTLLLLLGRLLLLRWLWDWWAAR
jgi:hypothetical protein